MNRLAHLVESFVDLGFCPFHPLLSQIDCVRQEPTTLFKLFRISTLLHLDAFVFEKLVHVLIQLIFFNRLHNILFAPKIPDSAGKSNYRSKSEL